MGVEVGWWRGSCSKGNAVDFYFFLLFWLLHEQEVGREEPRGASTTSTNCLSTRSGLVKTPPHHLLTTPRFPLACPPGL